MKLADEQFNGRRREMIDKMYSELYMASNEELSVLDRVKLLEENVSSLMTRMQEIERMVTKPQFDDEYVRRLIDDAIRNHVSFDHSANGLLPQVSRESLDMLRCELTSQMQQEFTMLLRHNIERGKLHISFDDYGGY